MSSTDDSEPKRSLEDGRAAMNRAVNQGQLFTCVSIASELARLPDQFEVDQDEKWRILHDLAARCSYGYFKDNEAIVCFGKPPRLVPIHEIDDQKLDIQPVMLTRAACKRYLEQSTSPNAARLLRAWFHEAESTNGKELLVSAGSDLCKPPRSSGGRKKGSGTIPDDESLMKMLELLAQGKARAAWAAAGMVTSNAGGPTSNESARRRVYGKFTDRFGTTPQGTETWAEVYERELKRN